MFWTLYLFSSSLLFDEFVYYLDFPLPFLTVQTQSMVNFCNLIRSSQQFTSDRSFPWSFPTRKVLSELFSWNSFYISLLCIQYSFATISFMYHTLLMYMYLPLLCCYSENRLCIFKISVFRWNCKFLNHYYSTPHWNTLAWTIDKLYCTKKWTYYVHLWVIDKKCYSIFTCFCYNNFLNYYYIKRSDYYWLITFLFIVNDTQNACHIFVTISRITTLYILSISKVCTSIVNNKYERQIAIILLLLSRSFYF